MAQGPGIASCSRAKKSLHLADWFGARAQKLNLVNFRLKVSILVYFFGHMVLRVECYEMKQGGIFAQKRVKWSHWLGVSLAGVTGLKGVVSSSTIGVSIF